MTIMLREAKRITGIFENQHIYEKTKPKNSPTISKTGNDSERGKDINQNVSKKSFAKSRERHFEASCACALPLVFDCFVHSRFCFHALSPKPEGSRTHT